MTGRNALFIKLGKPSGEQAIVSSWYTRWWWTADKDMKVEMILAVE